MPLSDKDKSEAIDALALAVALSEPETIIESLRRFSRDRAIDALLDANARNRWRLAHDALECAAQELERLNAPQRRDNGSQTLEPGLDASQPDC